MLFDEDIEVSKVQDWALFDRDGRYVLSQPDRQYAEAFAGDSEPKDHLLKNEHTQLYEELYANELEFA